MDKRELVIMTHSTGTTTALNVFRVPEVMRLLDQHAELPRTGAQVKLAARLTDTDRICMKATPLAGIAVRYADKVIISPINGEIPAEAEIVRVGERVVGIPAVAGG